MSCPDTKRRIGVVKQIYFCWHTQDAGMRLDQLHLETVAMLNENLALASKKDSLTEIWCSQRNVFLISLPKT